MFTIIGGYPSYGFVVNLVLSSKYSCFNQNVNVTCSFDFRFLFHDMGSYIQKSAICISNLTKVDLPQEVFVPSIVRSVHVH
jgi:hypothetical protein